MKHKLALGVVTLVAGLGGALGSTAFFLQPPKVPPELIEASVTRPQALLDRAWSLPAAASFNRDLAWQSNPSTCGPASLANVFRSLGEPAADTEAEVVKAAGPCWFGICPIGLTLDQLGEVARSHTRRRVAVMRDLTPEAFRDILRQSNDPARRYIVNFSREAIFGAGVGHHSPLGGYLEAEDLVFVLDVNSNFRPWLIERSRLFSAMDTLDGDKKRGVLLIE
jgi:hypothetical protein